MSKVVNNYVQPDPIVKATADEQHVGLHYRIVHGEEILKMQPLFDKLNWPLPDPDTANVLVAEAGLGNDAIIVGFVVVQFLPHVEPMWVYSGVRGAGVADELSRQVTHYVEHDCHIRRYLCCAKEGSFAARLAEARGMKPLPGYNVYIRDLNIT